jgi:phospholipid/cholesterol/gamma-HCH transport system substrate-binding protein
MRARVFSVVVAILVAAAVLAGFTIAAPADDGYTITADVIQAPNLFAGGRVMVRGVEVGEITAVEPRPEGVRLTLDIQEGVKVPADATLSVVPITVIADRYVQLFPAYKSGPTMADGDHIPLDRTAIPAELDDVLGQLKGLLGALEPRNGKRGPLAKLVESLDEALADRSQNLAGTLSSSADVLENLADSQSNITGLIANLDKLFLQLADSSSEIGLVNERFALVAEALAGDQDNLEGTIENLTLLADETAGLLAESGDKLGESFGRLGDVLRVILSHEKQLTVGARWANVVAQALGEVDGNGKGKYAYTGRQAPPGTEGAEYNYRIDSRDTVTCERIRAVSETILIILPQATVDDILETLLSYIPDVYDDDLEFLIRELIPLCTRLGDVPSVNSEAAAAIQQLADRVGEDRLIEYLARYITENVGGGSR